MSEQQTNSQFPVSAAPVSHRDDGQSAEAKPEQPKLLDGPELETARLRAALKHGLSEEHAHRLSGTTADELSADAAQFAELLAGARKPNMRTRPGAGADAGSDDAGANVIDPARLASAIIRRAAGRTF